MMAPEGKTSQSLEPLNTTVCGKEYTHTIRFRILNWDDDPGLSGWTPDAITCVLLTGRRDTQKG